MFERLITESIKMAFKDELISRLRDNDIETVTSYVMNGQTEELSQMLAGADGYESLDEDFLWMNAQGLGLLSEEEIESGELNGE